MAGTANLARSNVDFPLSIGPVLEALEEQVVMLRLLSDMAQDPRGVTVSIGRENPYDGLSEASVVATGYGPDATAKVGVARAHPDGLSHHHGRRPRGGPLPFPDPRALTASDPAPDVLPATGSAPRQYKKEEIHTLSSHYDVLGVSREATGEEIKKAYRKLARTLHPDVNPGDDASERFKAVTHAYEVLSDPQKRRVYDTTGNENGTDNGFGGGYAGQGFAFQDIFDTFFGGAGGQARPRVPGPPRPGRPDQRPDRPRATPSSASTRSSRSTPPSPAPPARAPAAARAATPNAATSAAAAARSSAPCAPSSARS